MAWLKPPGGIMSVGRADASDVTDREWEFIAPFVPAAQYRFARGCERAALYRLNGLPMADVTKGLSALLNGPAVFL